MTARLVDLHCHGAIGVEFGADAESSRRAVAHHRARGAADVVASLVSAPMVRLEAQVRTLAPLVAEGTLAGIHLEGPFLSPSRRGAHDPVALAAPDPTVVDRLVVAAAGCGAERAIVQWTLAPELDGAERVVDRLIAHGITPAFGHTDADAATVRAMIDRVVAQTDRPALITHLGNGMPPFHHRRGGPFAAAMAAASRGEAIVEVVADGIHLDDDVVRMIFETLGPQHIALVSDATSATGLGDGSYRLGSMPVVVTGGVARIGGDGPIAGSTVTLGDIVARLTEKVGLPAADVGVAACSTPRAVLIDA